MTKPSITKRSVKGAALTYNELDANFQNLKDATITVAGDTGSKTLDLNDTITVSGGVGLTSSVSGSTLTVNLDNTAVTAGSYTNANLTVDAQGRITAVSNGSSGSGSGTVNSGTGGYLAYYPSTGTTVDDTSVLSISSGTLVLHGDLNLNGYNISSGGVSNAKIDDDLYFTGGDGPVGNGNLRLRASASGGVEVNMGSNFVLTNGALTVPSASSVVSGSATDRYISIGTKGQLFDDGNFHIHTASGNLWINSLDGGDIALGLQSNSGTSKVTANNISMNAGYGSVAPIYGVRAWINFGWSGSSITTRASGNLSVTRSATGVYNFTFGTAMPDGNYSISAIAMTPNTNSDCAVNITNGTTPSTTGFSLTVARYGDGNKDVSYLCVQIVR